MNQPADQTIARIAEASEPAWLWDAGRRRVVFANGAGIAYFGEAHLSDLLDRRFPPDDPVIRMAGEAVRLRDGRPGRLVFAGRIPVEPDTDDLFGQAPVAMAVFNAAGDRMHANAEAQDLLMPGPLGIVVSSPYVANDLLSEMEGRPALTRTVPIATRFGMRRCRVVAKRIGSGDAARLLLSFDDVEDQLALAEAGVGAAPVDHSVPAAEATPVPVPVGLEPEPPPPPPAPRPEPIALGPSWDSALEEVVAALTDPTLAADLAGRLITMNAKAASLLGESAPGEPLLNMLPPDLKADAAAYIAASGTRGLERALEDGRETKIMQGNGAVPVIANFARLATGEILVQFRDLSATRATEDALNRAREDAEESSRAKTDYLAHISHELRTPLNAIIGFAEIMEMGRFGPIENAKYQEYVQDIRSSGELLLSLINDLLDLSKAESGRIELDPDAVEIRPIVLDVVRLLGPQGDRYGVTLRPAISQDVPAIVADARSLKQILLNLVGNAIKFGGDGSAVEVTVMLDAAGAVHISIHDDGPGMDAEDVRRAFEPYRRTKTSRGREGTGLGLPLARALVEANKAQFAIDSAPGRGTTIRVTFPSALVLAG